MRVSPKFCSMNYSSKVDEYNKQVHGIEGSAQRRSEFHCAAR
jgi:hypothetical protein